MSRRNRLACPVCGNPDPSPACWWGWARTCHPTCTATLSAVSKDYSKSAKGRLRSPREMLEALHGAAPKPPAIPRGRRSAENIFLDRLAYHLTPLVPAVATNLSRGHVWLTREPSTWWRDYRGLIHHASISPYVDGIPRISVNCAQPYRTPHRIWAALQGLSLREWERRRDLLPRLDVDDRGRLELTVLPRELTTPLAEWLAAALTAPALPDDRWTCIGPPPIELEGTGIGPGFVSPPGRLPSYLWSAAAVHEWTVVRGRR